MTSHSEATVIHREHKENVFLRRTFWARVFTLTKEDIVAAFGTLTLAVNVTLAILLGVALFLLEFPLVKEFVLYVIVLPVTLFLVVKYLTILPIVFFFLFLFIKIEYSIIILSLIVPFSLIWVLLV